MNYGMKFRFCRVLNLIKEIVLSKLKTEQIYSLNKTQANLIN